VGLAILTPNWMKYVLDDENVNDFYEYGVNVWNINPEESKYEVAQKAIEKTREYFSELGIPSTLKEVGIGEEKLEQMAKASTRNGTLGGFKPLSTEDVLNIYKLSL